MREDEILALRHAALRVVGRNGDKRAEMRRLQRTFERTLTEPGESAFRKLHQAIRTLPNGTRLEIVGTARAVLQEIQDHRSRGARAG